MKKGAEKVRVRGPEGAMEAGFGKVEGEEKRLLPEKIGVFTKHSVPFAKM